MIQSYTPLEKVIKFTREAFVFEITVNAVWKLVFHPKDKLGSASAVIETLICITGIMSTVTLSTGFKSAFQLTCNDFLVLVPDCVLYSYSNFNSMKVQSSRNLAVSWTIFLWSDRSFNLLISQATRTISVRVHGFILSPIKSLYRSSQI